MEKVITELEEGTLVELTNRRPFNEEGLEIIGPVTFLGLDDGDNMAWFRAEYEDGREDVFFIDDPKEVTAAIIEN